ncbi:conserved unknown protein [Ectocarpus siliculosus]|uniref:Protein-L-isoaspartate(D-aspartate) O-methyltransferase n=1 Tax=Ectocarpus siliculosus TaxID=2880 RepID=D8LSF0_ECTSI|nr:conserved unknown protein [Ectocarpus siliculosus]|eukprot:CBN75207.1 conserved unknown protein [Ectocarpus siliculosus]
MKLPRSNDELVAYMKKHGMVKTPAIIEAFRAVDRGDFATPNLGQLVYFNRPVQDGDVHLSAPFIYADALEELSPKPGMSFLNIGSGTCYLSYLVSMLVGELGVNHGVELNEALLEHSARCIASTDDRLGRKTDIQVLRGNGLSVAVEPGCGYDCVYVGAGCDPDLTLPYLQGLLNVGGVMVVPFREELVRMERMADGSFSSRALCNVCFSPIVMVDTKKEGFRGAPEPPPTVRFVVKPWSPLCHSVYPRSFRDTVLNVLMANAREDSLPGTLPPALWMEIMGFARRDWFSESAIIQEREATARAKRTSGGGGGGGRKGKGKAARADEGGSGGSVDASSSSSSILTSGCLVGAARTVALLPVRAGSAAATQMGCHVS